MQDLTYSEAIEKIMLENGGVATLKQLYKDIWKYKNLENLKGRTPNNTIQERVQRDSKFYRVGLGIYGLSRFKNTLEKIIPAKTKQEKTQRYHTQLQGMLLEIGNSKAFETYTSDKNCTFKNISLQKIATLERLPLFTYENIVKNSASFCDVVWINKRGFADSIFEVETSTNFRDALVKFSEMQDFYTRFYCVASQNRYEKFKKELSKIAFKNIQNRVEFIKDSDIINEYELALKQNQSLFKNHSNL
ncbi:hypothetical protein DCO58_06500 [Helicobacter saguini]|uniref:HTH HARE-type domain-containing protein n=1 Tax=Helicobacter saguini TaxID=1548018 RepID=A0A347VMV2_9HELI|nr:hypothetical protein [Helicobacter saguini]MWV62013.1 hypothetical protein [Helicobacter saguini]MWV67312.1 hypothetical protein [Helicobacter saguini]MWV69665.1 hypothetical protein [Helicobacter saguini]MWV73118.1 hypothetical protein [Helicobacter saguini]TLD95517.1 hypothetical protein LS64_001235 [Helicobacter saguini]